ncbi:MAG: hypothetical protein G8D88_13940 [gamma proteobacterium symbiont of Ctena orbiculata]
MSDGNQNGAHKLAGWLFIGVIVIMVGSVAYDRFTTPAAGESDYSQQVRAAAEADPVK